MKPFATGSDVLHSAALNKSTAFDREERERLGLRGLLPHAVCSQPLQLERVLAAVRRKGYDIERYIYLMSLQSRNERLFYRALIDHIEELMPIVYTPTVGQACKEFAHIFRQTRGFYITPEDRGEVGEILGNWPEEDVRVIVVTDGERILGLGDLGANGMGIPIGKLALYVACAGIHPDHCLPVMFDVGTDNDALRGDPLYLGIGRERLHGDAYHELFEEFVLAVQRRYPQALIQFEDFLTPNAFRLLDAYRDRVLCFNDDIQGTAAVALAGVLTSTRISGIGFGDVKVLFLGAGSAATGIADLMMPALQATGLSETAARERLWFVDGKGLVVRSRDALRGHKRRYAQDHPPATFVEAIRWFEPNVLIGATGSPGTFTEEVIGLMAEINPRPAIFALSNPTSRAECTAEQAYRWSDGRVIFASGSPFAPVMHGGREHRPGQGNNAYIFPGIGLGAIMCGAKRIRDEMFLAAAHALAAHVSEDDLRVGAVYPPLAEIREVSLRIAVAVARIAYEQDLARVPMPEDLEATIVAYMYDPSY